jgi:hypothetical protein
MVAQAVMPERIDVAFFKARQLTILRQRRLLVTAPNCFQQGGAGTLAARCHLP